MYESCQGFIDDISFLEGLFVVETQFNVKKFSKKFHVLSFWNTGAPRACEAINLMLKLNLFCILFLCYELGFVCIFGCYF
jgi:hypothetical protein